MPWEKIVKPPHRCTKPLLITIGTQYGSGSIWRCPECGKRWELVKSDGGGLRWAERTGS